MMKFSGITVILLMAMSATISSLLVFSTLRDSCFSASYASAFPGECYEQ